MQNTKHTWAPIEGNHGISKVVINSIRASIVMFFCRKLIITQKHTKNKEKKTLNQGYEISCNLYHYAAFTYAERYSNCPVRINVLQTMSN